MINLEKVYYVKEENSHSLVPSEQICVRDISTVSDYLRAITMIHSNYFILKYALAIDIRSYENMFSRDDTKDFIENIITNGVYFRGQVKDYNNVIPSLYRSLDSIFFEEEYIKRAELSSPKEFSSTGSFLGKLALMQHYGMTTRILDITTNALVALYFAVEDGVNNLDTISDGVIFLYKKEFPQVETELSERVCIKANISRLSIQEKISLFKVVNNASITDKENLLLTFQHIFEISRILRKLIDYSSTDLGYAPTIILKEYLFGAEIVYASEIDSRIMRQSGLFIIWGLDCLDKISECGINEKSEDDKKAILQEIQTGINKTLEKMEFIYSPEIFLKQGKSQGNVRIKIKKEYKKQILSELKLLGITGQAIYPDLQHKLEYIKNLKFKL